MTFYHVSCLFFFSLSVYFLALLYKRTFQPQNMFRQLTPPQQTPIAVSVLSQHYFTMVSNYFYKTVLDFKAYSLHCFLSVFKNGISLALKRPFVAKPSLNVKLKKKNVSTTMQIRVHCIVANHLI